MNYFIWNKEEDYREGQLFRVKADKNGLTLKQGNSMDPGYYVSRIFDSGEDETIWHRMLAEVQIGENMSVDLAIFGTDGKERIGELNTRLNQNRGDETYIESLFEPFLKMKLHNPGDVLLHTISARFLWFTLTLWGNGSTGPKVSKIQMWFPKESWISFLPECYQTNKSSFLERYLAIFETLYREMEEEIREGARCLDISSTPDNMLSWLSKWLDMEHTHLWPQERLRRYLEEGAASYAFRGTKRGLLRMVWIYTGETPYILESRDREYPYEFCLYITQKSVPSVKEYNALHQIIREGKPAWMEIRLQVLKPYLFLNQDSYIGINSVLATYRTGILDGNSMIPFAVLGGKET